MIELSNVTFRYGHEDEEAENETGVENITLSVKAGQCVVLCGRSGCGKSTLLRLIARLYDPQKGKVLFGGSDEREMDPENEVEMQKTINGLIKGRTVIMIAHRLKTVVKADNIIVLDKGKIVEQGRNKELIKSGSLYAKPWDLQTKTSGWKISV